MEKKIKYRSKTRQNLSNPHYNLSEKELLKQRNKIVFLSFINAENSYFCRVNSFDSLIRVF